VYFDINDAALNSQTITVVFGDAMAPNIVTFAQHDRFGRLTHEGFFNGATVRFEYDLAGRVVREIGPGVNNEFTHGMFGVTEVRNIESNTARSEFDSLGRVTATSDFMGNYTRFEHDALGRLIEQRVPFEVVNGTRHYAITRYFYDNNGNVTRTTTRTNVIGQIPIWAHTVNVFEFNLLVSSQIGGANGFTTTYTYDLAGNILTQTVGDATTTFAYNTRGQLVSTTDALGQVETYTYDANHGKRMKKLTAYGKIPQRGVLRYEKIYRSYSRPKATVENRLQLT